MGRLENRINEPDFSYVKNSDHLCAGEGLIKLTHVVVVVIHAELWRLLVTDVDENDDTDSKTIRAKFIFT